MEGTDHQSRTRSYSGLPARHSQDWTNMYSPVSSIHHYHAHPGISYLSPPRQIQYSPNTTNYPTYASPYLAAGNSHMFLPSPTTMAPSYSVRPPPRSATLPSQHRILSRNGYYSLSGHHSGTLRGPLALDLAAIETEDQDSPNRDSMKSEALDTPLQGYPKVEDFDKLMSVYVAQLSPKKQDKALINARRAANIRAVLIDKKTTSIESAQFRFWVKKMFELQPVDSSVSLNRRKICHEGKPVAIKEKLFKILTRAHQQCQHGGRDKTSAQVRRIYSWVPKELISRFVKICPTCQTRRGTSRNSPIGDEKELDLSHDENDDDDEKMSVDRRASRSSQQIEEVRTEPFVGSDAFDNQNRWLTGYAQHSPAYEKVYAASTTRNNSVYSIPTDVLEDYDNERDRSHRPSHARHTSARSSKFKQEAYRYN